MAACREKKLNASGVLTDSKFYIRFEKRKKWGFGLGKGLNKNLALFYGERLPIKAKGHVVKDGLSAPGGEHSASDPAGRKPSSSWARIIMSGEITDIRQYIANYVARNNADYNKVHEKRYKELGALIPRSENCGFAIELGCTELFQVLLKAHYKYGRVMGTNWNDNVEEKICRHDFSIGELSVTSELVSIDLEKELFPLEADCVDFVLCSEVIEHLDIDPMFMLAELNRIMRKGAILLITSPNCCSARNFWKIAHGFRPHFFMQYIRNRSTNRHNFEYDMQSLRLIVESAGFKVDNAFTKNVFEPEMDRGMKLLESMSLPTEDRGDGIFALCKKVSGVVNRWPGEMYV